MANRSDNFNDSGDVNLHGRTPSDSGSTWVEETAGQWKTATDATSGRIVAYNLGGPMSAWLESSVTDHEAAADVVTVLSNVGVTARLADVNNFYLFRSLAGATELYKRVSGTYTKLGDGSIGVVTNDQVACRCVGTSIKGFVNGAEAISVTDSSLTTGTKFGIYGGAGYVDDFEGTDLSGGGGATTGLYLASLGVG